MGRDADHPRARGEVGKVGVSISSLRDMEVLLKGIPLGEVSTSMTINATAAILLCLYAAVGEQQGVALEKLSGTVQNDILKEYMARGTYIYPPRPSLRLITDVFAFCAKRVPQLEPHLHQRLPHPRGRLDGGPGDCLHPGGRHRLRGGGAEAPGCEVDAFAGRLSFFFNVHNNFLEEVAKFRAARRLWARIMKERFKAKDPRSMMLRFHAQTAGSTLTAQQVDNNVVRVALQALAAVLGGAQSLHTNSRDEALALPSEEAARLALRTQQMIAYETGVADMVDPLGGSYAAGVDDGRARGQGARTTSAASTTWAAWCGPSPRAIRRRRSRRPPTRRSATWRKKRSVVVGVNEFQVKEPPPKGCSAWTRRWSASRPSA